MTTRANRKQNHAERYGESFPIGPSARKGGVNFSLYSKNGLGVELLLFDNLNDLEPSRTIRLDPKHNRTYHYWHVFVEGIQPGQLYAYRVNGPHAPHLGHRFDGSKILLDPYAKATAVPNSANPQPHMKSVVVDLSLYDWENDQHPRRPFAQTVIYEMHVAGFTKHANSGVPPEKRGTYAGLIEKIPYLVDLGITAVELLPIFQFDPHPPGTGQPNYWGYNPVSFFSIHQAYSQAKDARQTLDEFRDMVKALHRAGIEVILDVVYNHTAEGGEGGPTYSFRGIDNSVYYSLEEDKSRYANYSGCGNTLNANQPIVRRMIIDSLHFWVKSMHVDGFRFDLASILSRDERGNPVENPPILWDIESDPVLAGTKLIAEAWDAAGLYQVGSFIGDSWKEWNGKFRDDVRRFFRGENGLVTPFVTRMVGSPDLYKDQHREPEQSVNFVTCHDGFTLNDLVSYNQKHNEANGEDNRDGCNNNHSQNFGIEGPSDDPVIEAMRNRQVKNFLAVTLLSLGAPMLLMGDEVRRTQRGNNNAYCQDNDISWFDWSLIKKHGDILRFVQQLNAFRVQRDSALEAYSMSLDQMLNQSLVTWHGVRLHEPDWSDHSHSIAMTIQSLSGNVTMHYMINAHTGKLEFELPEPSQGKWKRWMDTSLESPEDIAPWRTAAEVVTPHYSVEPFTVVILVADKS